MNRRTLFLTLFLVASVACSPPSKSTDAGPDAEPVDRDLGGGGGGEDAPDAEVDLVDSDLRLRYRVATFNVGRFFDTICHTGQCDNGDFERQLSEAEFNYKADQIAEGIRELDVDAVLLQEIENQTCLDALVERLAPRFAVAEIGETGQNASLDVAVLASGELLERVEHRANTTLMLSDGRTKRFTREFLELHVEVDEERVVLFNAHFKAKRNDDPAWRLAEAEAARDIVNEVAGQFPQALLVMGGDLNDTPDSEPIRALRESDALNLVTEQEDEPMDSYWTFTYQGDGIAIDHLLLGTSEVGRYIANTVEVARDQSGGWGGSDHASLVADFGVVDPSL